MADKKAKNKIIGRPNRFLYGLAYHFLKPLYRHRYGLEFDCAELSGLQGPALVIAPHTSNKDHWLIGMALYPHRPTFVVSRHFMAKPKLRPILREAHVITKRMFCPDVGTVMDVLRARREGNIIVLFPEGRLACNGRTGTVTDGTAELAKKLGIPVYVVTANGASCTFPKWAKKPRRGKIRVTGRRLLTAEEVATLSPEVIHERMQAAITHDDMAAMAGIRYRSRHMAEGLDGILYRCPACHENFRMQTKGRLIFCTCGMTAELDETYRLHGAPFETIAGWYDWQTSELSTDTPLTTHARIGTPDARGNMDPNAGEADVYMDKDVFTVDGTLHGQPFSFTRRTESIGAFPVTVRGQFDVYYNNTLYYIFPQPDERASVMWVAWLDRLTAERRAAGELAEKP